MNFKAIVITAWIWFPALATAHDAYNESYLVCKSPECIERAELINESLNTTIHPCTDFYSHVCSRWESAHQPLGPSFSYDVYQDIGKDIPEKLSYVLGNRSMVAINQTIIDKITVMYNACLALPDPRDALITVLNESGFNGWPILTEQNIFNSSNCTDLLRQMSISSILYVHLIDMKRSINPYHMVIECMPVQVKIQKMANIGAVINNTIKLINPEINISVLENLTNELVQFASYLSAITDEEGSTRRYTISKLESLFGSNIPISDLLKKEFTKVNITFNDEVQFSVQYKYYEKLSVFLGTTKPNTLYNYAGFLTAFSYIPYVNMSTEDAFSNEHTHSTTQDRNWRECIDLLEKSTRDILDYLYVTAEINHTIIKSEVEDIARRLKQAFNETLQTNSWIDNTTREALRNKLEDVTLGIGYPDTLLNMSVLETRYQYVPIFPLNISFTEAQYYIEENSYKMQLRKLGYPEEGDLGWDRSTRDLRRPFHDQWGTKIEIPYALFVAPLFRQGLPRSLNYGGIGVEIARALADRLSTAGIQNINTTSKGILTQNFSVLFINKTSCFVEQYKAANLKMLPEKSTEPPYVWTQTLAEDLDDNAGLHMAFISYQKALEEECQGMDTRLAGLETTSGKQLFLITSAMTTCKIADNATLFREIGWPQYSPAQNRVNISMKNMEESAEAFNCSLGSPMHPPKNETCSMW